MAAVFCALVLGIAELICSLFTAAKGGDRRNMTAFGINAAVFALTAFLAIGFGARAKVGLAVTFGIYLLQFLLHTKVSGKNTPGCRRRNSLAGGAHCAFPLFPL